MSRGREPWRDRNRWKERKGGKQAAGETREEGIAGVGLEERWGRG